MDGQIYAAASATQYAAEMDQGSLIKNKVAYEE
jgi:hypothetical protein